MKRDVLDQLCADRADKRAVALVTHLATGIQTLLYPTDNNAETGLDPAIIEAALQALHDDKSRMIESADGDVFIHVHNPPLRLIIVGAVHIAQPLARMAVVAGYAVTVIDPRQAFASPEQFDDVALCNDWPDEAMRALEPDGRTAVVIDGTRMLRSLLRTARPVASVPTGGVQCRAWLVSAISGGQWPQARRAAVKGWHADSLCQLCLGADGK